MKSRRLLGVCTLATAFAVAGCDLEVINPNQPESERVLATPNDLESLLGSYYRRWDDGLYRTLGSVWGMANVQSFENYSSLANNAQNARGGIPRPTNDNSIGNVAQGEQARVYFVHSEVNRVASTILKQLNTAAYSLGGTPARDLRAKAFAEFLRGMSLGYLALIYDSAAVVSDAMAGDDRGVLIGYRNVMDSALAALDRAITHTAASAADPGADGFPLPSNWMPNTKSMTATEFTRLVRSYRARLRANLARIPAERAHAAASVTTAGTATDWNQVIADAQNGITSDNYTVTSGTAGPFKTWIGQYASFQNWHQMPAFFTGQADTSGTYASWIAQNIDARSSFTMATPDLRFPQGANRAAQEADFAVASCEIALTTCKRYYRNRPQAQDNVTGLGWGLSEYDNARFWSWVRRGDAGTAVTGRIVSFTMSENRLLEAEGHIRLGAYAAAVPLINASRQAGMVGGVATGGGLPAVTVTGVPVPVGNECVPKVPQNASHNGGGTVVCATDAALGGVGRGILEAMKYEKRFETHFTHFAAWFLDHRGWGDLTATTPLHWAPPYQDLQARQKALYSTGEGTSGGMSAGLSASYGW